LQKAPAGALRLGRLTLTMRSGQGQTMASQPPVDGQYDWLFDYLIQVVRLPHAVADLDLTSDWDHARCCCQPVTFPPPYDSTGAT
jgi:hypothetical protein